ncbi:MAG TPA: hypothetical protein PLI09_15180 [Candidatus Hydrogenedentes bacterium]|nr:hypothetical protein [Candidatus Hydrogenedentota bacterium]
MEITQPIFTALRVLERLETALSLALETDTERILLACREFLRLYASPIPVFYDPCAFLLDHKEEITAGRHELRTEPVSECAGIPERLLTCLKCIIDSTRLEEDAALFLEVLEQEERREKIPRIGLGLDGPGCIPNDFFMEGMFRLPFDELNNCWTLATRGGRIDRTPNGLDLRLKGMRLTPSPLEEADRLLAMLESVSTKEDITMLLEHLKGETREEACDVRVLVQEVLQDQKEAFQRASIPVETRFDPAMPPILVCRTRIKTFLSNICEYALCVLDPEGAVTLSLDYTEKERSLTIQANFSTTRENIPAGFHFPLLRRITEEHGGLLDIAECPAQPPKKKRAEVHIEALLPDRVGKELDHWIPGWGVFSARSQQMLRLIKSGASPLPEEFILGGVLEDELERWLMPRLATPLAQNLAHELKPAKSDIPGSDMARLAKALGPISKGKPKKELCKPGFAGELFWHFRQGERARKALGTNELKEDEIKEFCQALLASPPRHAFCLTMLATLLKNNSS